LARQTGRQAARHSSTTHAATTLTLACERNEGLVMRLDCCDSKPPPAASVLPLAALVG
jgi:hypothetical protein